MNPVGPETVHPSLTPPQCSEEMEKAENSFQTYDDKQFDIHYVVEKKTEGIQKTSPPDLGPAIVGPTYDVVPDEPDLAPDFANSFYGMKEEDFELLPQFLKFRFVDNPLNNQSSRHHLDCASSGDEEMDVYYAEDQVESLNGNFEGFHLDT